MDDAEALSRLAAGDLDPAAERALRERIAAEPALAARWQGMLAVIEDLRTLPEERPPAWLDARLSTPARRPSARWAWAVALAASAVAGALALRTPDRTKLVLSPGESTIQGAVDVALADATVAIDGVARVDVEPAPGVAREPGTGGEAMSKTWLVAGGSAAAGALVAVAVLEGAATVSYHGGPVTVVSPGQSWSAPVAGRSDEATHEADVAGLQARVAELEAKLAVAQQEATGAKLAGALANGQLANVQGTPVPWPADVPEAFQPARYEADVRAAVAAVPGAKVAEVDCSEYPCLAMVTLATDGDVEAVRPELEGIVRSLRDGVWQGIPGLSVTQGESVETPDDGTGGTVVLGIGAGGQVDDDVNRRTKYRLETLMDDASQELPAHAP